MKMSLREFGTVLALLLALCTTGREAQAQTGWGNALVFDGANDYVLVSNFGGAVPTSEITVEFWQRVHSVKAQSTFGLDPDNVNNRFQAHLPWSSGAVYWDFGNINTSGRLFYTPPASLVNSWHHFSLVARPGYMAVYRNGVLEVEANRAGTFIPGNFNLRLGVVSGIGYFDGELDEFRIWNKARSREEIRADMNHPLKGTEPNLVAYWNFDEGSGTIVQDGTTNAHHGTLASGTASPSWTASSIPAFNNVNAWLPNVTRGSAAWGDYNNDGRLDILMTGRAANLSKISRLWQNTGNGFSDVTTAVMPGLQGVNESSVAWGDYDNDGLLDVLVTGAAGEHPNYNRIAEVWRNTGSGFAKINLQLPGVRGGAVAWGDYDNDGRLDILLMGQSAGGDIAQLWRNTPAGFTNVTTQVAPGLPGLEAGSVAWGDYDNDGRLDFLLTGATASGSVFSQVWRNVGGAFTNVTATLAPGLPGVNQGSGAWGDYDNDGLLDILLTGANVAGNPIAQVWRNTGTGFASVNVVTGARWGSSAWGDYDNDGRLDVVVTGETGSGTPLAQLWRNTAGGFAKTFEMTGVTDSSVTWGDYDNDGRLDILLLGQTSSDYLTQLWRNNAPLANTPPIAPAGLTSTEGSFSWSPAGDAETPSAGLTYNLRVGTTNNGSDVVAPQASLDAGLRRLPAFGNAQQGLSGLGDFTWGVYYWSVQAVDTAFAGSPWAPEARLVIAVKALPATEVGLTTATLNGIVAPLNRSTRAWFEWGASTNYGQASPLVLEGSGSAPTNISCVVTGLVLHTYHYRVVASNELGVLPGLDSVIQMQLERPQVETLSAADLAPTSATLQGTVNPKERATTAWFEYGLTAKYTDVTPAVNLEGGVSPVSLNNSVTGLLPWMMYHYRAVATNSVGRTDGPDMTVTLPGPPLVPPSLSALPNVTLMQGNSTSIWFSAQPAEAVVRVSCNNPVLLPANRIGLAPSGQGFTLTLTPDPQHSGFGVVTVSARDNVGTTRTTFTVSVTPVGDQQNSQLYLTNATSVSDENWRFRLVDAGSGSTNYTVEYRPDLSPASGWTIATNVTDLGGGVFAVDTGPPQPGFGFYRVKGIRLLAVGVGSGDLTVDEGATGQMGPVVVFNGAYSGILKFTWSTTTGVINGTVLVNGTTAVIPIPNTVQDNGGIDQFRSLTFSLESGTGYALAGATETKVQVEDNDADWQGTLVIPNGVANTTTAWLTNRSNGFTTIQLPQNASMTIGFTLSVAQSGGSLLGRVWSDRYGFFPSTSLAQLTLGEKSFCAVATNIPMPTLAGSVFFDRPHHMDLRLDAANADGQTNVSPTRISGVATLVSVVPGRPYLDSAVSGTFLLLKPPVIPSTNQVPLTPTAP